MSNPSQPLPGPSEFKRLVLPVTLLLAAFSWPLYELVRFSLGSELYSHVVLIPVVSIYLGWLKQPHPLSASPRLAPAWALAFLGSGVALLAACCFFHFSGSPLAVQDSLALAMYSLVLLLAGICCRCLSRATMRTLVFPLSFLVFLAPLPLVLEQALETFLQHGSAWVAHLFFNIIGTPVYRDGTLFHLPGFNMQVAPECSGIHSTVALFITSLVAGQLLLRAPWSRALLACIVLPIALLRNGFRVTVIGELCVRIGPEMIDSYIHRHGGPIFFALSLIPFSLVLFSLLKLDRKDGHLIKPTP